MIHEETAEVFHEESAGKSQDKSPNTLLRGETAEGNHEVKVEESWI